MSTTILFLDFAIVDAVLQDPRLPRLLGRTTTTQGTSATGSSGTDVASSDDRQHNNHDNAAAAGSSHQSQRPHALKL